MPTEKPFETIPLRTPAAMIAQLSEVADKLGKSQQETMRLCLDIGLKWMEAHDYNLDQKIVPIDVVTTLQGLLKDALDRLSEETARLAQVPAASKTLLRVAEPKAGDEPLPERKPVKYPKKARPS